MKRHQTLLVRAITAIAILAPQAAAAFFHNAEVRNGKTLYAQNCASCHGANLQGQPDWRSPGPDGIFPAPPHDADGHTWHHADQMLSDYVSLGGAAALALSGLSFDSGMPGFGEVLTQAEISDILAYIKSTWPARERDFQQARTDADAL